MEAQKTTQGWLDAIKSKFQELSAQFDLSWSKATEYSVALGGGILVGFLVKRYGKQTITTLLVLAALLLGLNYLGFIAIEWDKVKDVVGFAPTGTLETIFQDYWQWALAHVVSVFLSIVGFLIGFKIG